MRVLVADKFEQSGLDGLKSIGCTVIYDPDVKDDSLTESILKNVPDILVVRSTKVTEKHGTHFLHMRKQNTSSC